MTCCPFAVYSVCCLGRIAHALCDVSSKLPPSLLPTVSLCMVSVIEEPQVFHTQLGPHQVESH